MQYIRKTSIQKGCKQKNSRGQLSDAEIVRLTGAAGQKKKKKKKSLQKISFCWAGGWQLCSSYSTRWGAARINDITVLLAFTLPSI